MTAKSTHLTVGLIALSAFLAPLMGGQITVETVPLVDGIRLLNGPETPLLSHAVLALPAVIALCYAVAKRKILQVPTTTLGALWVAFVGLATISLAFTQFRSTTLPLVLELALVSAALFGTVAGVGRRRGPRIVLQSLLAGASIVAILGLQEYSVQRHLDPSWRIFATWCEPNAAAALFMVAVFVGLGLVVTSERTESLVCGVATVLCGFGLMLTQSRGVFLCAAVSGVVFLVLLARSTDAKGLLKTVGVVAIIASLFFAVGIQGRRAGPSGATGSTATSRLTTSSKSGDQSSQFRLNLWKGTPPIIRAFPAGAGLGTYRYYSAKSGLTTQTVLAHESFLQYAVECSIFAPLVLTAFYLVWLIRMLRPWKTLPMNQNVLRASVLCAVLSILLHSLLDSDFFFFGIAFLVAILVGIGILLAGDSVSPEFTPRTTRGLVGFVAAGAFLLLLWLGQNQLTNASMLAALQTRNTAGVQSLLPSIESRASFDAEASKLMISASENASDRAKYIMQTAELAPSTSNLRAAARQCDETSASAKAKMYVERALDLDPNNPNSLRLLAEIQGRMQLEDMRLSTLRRLVATEETIYFKTRSLPEVVETGTYEARVLLAEKSNSAAEKVSLLGPAVKGFAEYRDTTVPFVRRMIAAGQSGIPGENANTIEAKLKLAVGACQKLQVAYRGLGETGKAVAVAAELKRFEEALTVTLK